MPLNFVTPVDAVHCAREDLNPFLRTTQGQLAKYMSERKTFSTKFVEYPVSHTLFLDTIRKNPASAADRFLCGCWTC
jgi:hypothetical protein